MVTTLSTRLHADGVLTALRTLEPQIMVGDGERPDADVAAVFYPLDGGMLDGPVADPDADVQWPFQVTCVGTNAAEARWVADKVRAVLPSITVEGRVVDRVEPDGALGSVRRDDTTASQLFFATPRWRLHTTPA